MPLCRQLQHGKPFYHSYDMCFFIDFNSKWKFKVSVWLEKSVRLCVGAHATIYNVFEYIPLYCMFFVTCVWRILDCEFVRQRYFNCNAYLRIQSKKCDLFWIALPFYFFNSLSLYNSDEIVELRTINVLAENKQSQLQIYKTLTDRVSGHSVLKQLSALIAYIENNFNI